MADLGWLLHDGFLARYTSNFSGKAQTMLIDSSLLGGAINTRVTPTLRPHVLCPMQKVDRCNSQVGFSCFWRCTMLCDHGRQAGNIGNFEPSRVTLDQTY
jgi:hypothetical protein